MTDKPTFVSRQLESYEEPLLKSKAMWEKESAIPETHCQPTCYKPKNPNPLHQRILACSKKEDRIRVNVRSC
jgi:hypothetical protein